MKPSLIVLAPAVIVASLAFPALAEPERNAQPLGQSSSSTNPSAAMPARASDIVGLEVRNYQDEKLGKVQDLVIDVALGRVAGLLVSIGGVLGVGDRSVEVAWTAFHYDADRKVLHLDRTKTDLEANLETTKATDDRNARPGSPAVTDQGNNERDLGITVQIRKDVLRQSGLSVSAQNVKIITVNGRVTLRGSVASEEERRAIAQLAESAAPGQVDNQLEVTPADVNR